VLPPSSVISGMTMVCKALSSCPLVSFKRAALRILYQYTLRFKTNVTKWGTILREKLTVAQLKKSLAFRGTMWFITAFIRASHRSVSWVNWIQITSWDQPSNLHLGLRHQDLTRYAFITSPVRAVLNKCSTTQLALLPQRPEANLDVSINFRHPVSL
jgi:hypothetical protein